MQIRIRIHIHIQIQISGNGGEGRKKSGPRESRGRSTVSSEKIEAITIIVRGMKDAKGRAQRDARRESAHDLSLSVILHEY